MTHHLSCALMFISISIFIPIFASANEIDSRNPNFYDNPDTCIGWFCYKDYPNLDTPENNKVEQSSNVFSGTINWDEVWTIPPEYLKKLINETLSWAQQSPDDENRMLTYLSLQGVAMRRAKAF